MKKKLMAIVLCCTFVLCCIFMVSLVGCSNSDQENADTSNYSIEFVTIDDSILVYDSATKIVYMKNFTNAINCAYTPYYAPNGLPYRYNTETNSLEEINN